MLLMRIYVTTARGIWADAGDFAEKTSPVAFDPSVLYRRFSKCLLRNYNNFSEHDLTSSCVILLQATAAPV